MPHLPEKMKIALVIGTRPEAIKMAPVYRAIEDHPRSEVALISTGQHRELLHQTLASLELEPAVDLALMQPGQTLDGLCAQIHSRLPPVLTDLAPDAVLVQGDTTTAMAAALCAFHNQIPVGHIEAGLRTGDLEAPFPEEGNRLIIDRISRWCFAPTEQTAKNLRAEGISAQRITVTGNTGIDSLLWMLERPTNSQDLALPVGRSLPESFVLLTLHRRESFGLPLRAILHGVGDFLAANQDASVVWPLHPNPRVTEAFNSFSEAGHSPERILQIPPPPYKTFCHLLRSCKLVLSDSGGVQEESPSLGKRVLIARETTERPEAVTSGHNVLVGRDRKDVGQALHEAWQEPPYSGPLPAPNPYGDGRAAQRILKQLAESPFGTRDENRI